MHLEFDCGSRGLPDIAGGDGGITRKGEFLTQRAGGVRGAERVFLLLFASVLSVFSVVKMNPGSVPAGSVLCATTSET